MSDSPPPESSPDDQAEGQLAVPATQVPSQRTPPGDHELSEDVTVPEVVRGPWLLRAHAIYGSGRHSQIKVFDVAVIDLGAPPDNDPVRDPAAPRGSSGFVPPIIEEVEPTAGGLNIACGDQELVAERGEDGPAWSVRDVDRE